jgi:hypothetical protein
MTTTKSPLSAVTNAFSRVHEEKDKEKSQIETFPIPIRDDFVVKIELPRNLKKSEADKIGRVLAALAEDENNTATSIPFPNRV